MTAALAKRLEKVEAKRAEAAAPHASTTQLILDARHHGRRRPVRTAALLNALAAEPGLLGRIARADLRIGRIGASTALIDDPEAELAQMMGELATDPLSYVMWAYEWDTDASLRLVKLPQPWASIYACEHGPDEWAARVLDEIGRQVRERGFSGSKAVEAVRVAISSGHGCGKSVLTAWLCDWIMSTRPNARGVITASTSPQLESKTWATVAAWTRKCITQPWFDLTTGRGSMRMTHRDAPESWRCDAQTAAKDRAESFAGLHAADSSAFYLVDESTGVPDAIHEVMQGGLTDSEPFLIAMGNPTKNSGWFHGAFHAMRHRWTNYQIDSRTVQITNKQELDQWCQDFGENSDFVKVRVRGVFPSASSLQFIDSDTVDAARKREVEQSRHESIIVGVDPARFGDDASTIYTRQGRDGRTFPPLRYRGIDTMHLAARVTEHVNFLRSAGRHVLIAVDGGGVGGGVIDRLRMVGMDCIEVQFGGKANDSKRFANRRAEIWSLMREWLKGGALPDDEELATDLQSVEYGFNAQDAILLESKQSMKARGLASPDAADALAVTFAVTAALYEPEDLEARQRRREEREAYRANPIDYTLRRPGVYDPFKARRR